MLPQRVETVSALAPGPEHSDEHKKQPNGISNPAHIASLRVGGDQSRVAGTAAPHTRGRCSPVTTQSGRIERLSAATKGRWPSGVLGGRTCDVRDRCIDHRSGLPTVCQAVRDERSDPRANVIAFGAAQPLHVHNVLPFKRRSLHVCDLGPGGPMVLAPCASFRARWFVFLDRWV